MEPTIRPLRPDEVSHLIDVLAVAAGRGVPGSTSAVPPTGDDGSRALGVFDDGRLVGGTGWEPIELTVPGDAGVDAAKITLTGLLPTHRHGGLASRLMQRQLNDLARVDRSVAVLMTAKSGVPGRHGFRPATCATALRIAPGHHRLGSDITGGILLEQVTGRDAVATVPRVFEEHRHQQPGQVSRSAAFWAEWFRDDPELRIGPGERCFVLARDAERRCAGYLTYRLGAGRLREQPIEELFIEELIAVDDDARRALWAFCLGFDQATLVSAWNVPLDDPVRWMVTEPGVVEVTRLQEFLRARLIDVRAALAARCYTIETSLVVEVTDPVLPQNEGRFALVGSPQGATCESTRAPADISLDVSTLAAAYLGAVDLTALARAGLVIERRAGRLRLADLAFSVHPLPWAVTDW